MIDDQSKSPLVHLDLKALSEVGTKLLDCVSKAIGAVYKPRAIVQEAKATAEAGLILAHGEIDKARLIRAAARWTFIEDRRQAVIESVITQALAQLPETAGKEPVSEDWTVQFFEDCKDVGDVELQKLWAKILAGEVAKPGSFSRRTMQMLKTFCRFDAEAFTAFCSICFHRVTQDDHLAFWCEGTCNCLPRRYQEVDLMGHLITIGLVRSGNDLTPVSRVDGWQIEHFGSRYVVSAPPAPLEPEPEYVLSLAPLTAVGEELFRIVQPAPAKQLIENLSQQLGLLGLKFDPSVS